MTTLRSGSLSSSSSSSFPLFVSLSSLVMQQWENEKHPGLETALPSYNNSCAAARPNTKACHHDDAVYPPALLVAPMPEPKGRGLDKKAYA